MFFAKINQFLSYRRLPLAWLMLRRHPAKLITAFLGVAASGALILMQLVLQDSLFQSSVSIVNKTDADLLLISKQSASLISFMSFPEERLSTVLRSPDVEEAYPVRFRFLSWRLAGESKSRLALAVGINPHQAVFNDTDISSQQMKLVNRNDVLFDRLSRPEFGSVASDYMDGKSITAFAGKQRLKVVGLVKFGPSFGYDASILTTISTVSEFNTANDFAINQPIEMGIIKLRDGVNPLVVSKAISRTLPPDVDIMTKSQYETNEKVYWDKSKPIGFVFSFMTITSLVVGGTMVYQLLHMDVTFHLSSYAVLMSIGYKRGKLESIVFAEGIILSSFGFPVAWLTSLFLCRIVSAFTLMDLDLNFNMLASTYTLLVLMCSASALLAMAKIKDADPSDLF